MKYDLFARKEIIRSSDGIKQTPKGKEIPEAKLKTESLINAI